MNLSNVRFALSRHWSNLRSRVLAGDSDLLKKAAFVLLVTGAVMIFIALCA